MGYKPIGKTKTIVLPLPTTGTNMTLDQYKDKYGIDLRGFIILDQYNYISIKIPHNAVCFLDPSDCYTAPDFQEFGLNEIGHSYVSQEWESGVKDARLELLYSDLFGLVFEISKDDEFNIENIKVSSYEL